MRVGCAVLPEREPEVSAAQASDPEDWIVVKQAAAESGKSDDTIVRWVQRYGIGRRDARGILVSRSRLRAHMETGADFTGS